jgi:hypothetical protein
VKQQLFRSIEDGIERGAIARMSLNEAFAAVEVD